MESTALILRSGDETLGPNDITDARFLERPHQYNDPKGMPNAIIWIVQADKLARDKSGKSWHVWIEPNIYESLRKNLPELVNWIQGFDRKLSKLGFCEGRPMVKWPIKIPKCVASELPHKLVSCTFSTSYSFSVCASVLGDFVANPWPSLAIRITSSGMIGPVPAHFPCYNRGLVLVFSSDPRR